MPVGADGNARDRRLGEYWEDRFCEIATTFGWEAWPFQRKRGSTFKSPAGTRFICPDVWILRRGERQYACEIKHKDACALGYGFEEYRAQSLMDLEAEYTNQFGPVIALYVVHNHARAGGKWAKTNRLSDWTAQRLHILEESHTPGMCPTYYAGKVTDHKVPIHYYHTSLFGPLEDWLGDVYEQQGLF